MGGTLPFTILSLFFLIGCTHSPRGQSRAYSGLSTESQIKVAAYQYIIRDSFNKYGRSIWFIEATTEEKACLRKMIPDLDVRNLSQAEYERTTARLVDEATHEQGASAAVLDIMREGSRAQVRVGLFSVIQVLELSSNGVWQVDRVSNTLHVDY